MLGASANALTAFSGTFEPLLITRFSTGFFLAGIYPVGMKIASDGHKIASDWHKKGLGNALGYLVGALVLGKAFPFLLKFFAADYPWQTILFATSWFATFGGVLLYFAVPDGPYQSKKGAFEPAAMFRLFKNPDFKSAAFGYFGHMWELYTFWAFVPVITHSFVKTQGVEGIDISMITFLIIGAGGISCAVGGYLSLKNNSKKVALVSLIPSGTCCILLRLFFQLPIYLFSALMIVWGIFVIPDSPQFSTVVANSADRSYVATGLTIVNSIGFALTIVSIQLVSNLWAVWQSPYVFLVIAAGPAFGAWAISRYGKEMERSKIPLINLQCHPGLRSGISYSKKRTLILSR